MAQLNLGFSRLSVPEKIARVRMYISRLTGNANFPTPNPSLAALTTAVDELEAAYDSAQTGNKAARLILNEKEAIMDTMVTTLGADVLSQSGGDPLKIISAGMDPRKKPTPVGALPAPTGLLATVSTTEGAVELSWDAVKGARSYLVYISNDLAGTQWSIIDGCPSASYTATGLVSGKKYLFRVVAVGTAGNSPASDPAVGMAG